MAATTAQLEQAKRPHQSQATSAIACPDPAAHGRDAKLQEQASTAALYVTHPDRANRHVNPLAPDGKLSSASAATSLKYARAQDLPGYPIVGIDTANSAGSAALLAAGNKTKIERWKPEASDNAAKAALLAKDYKMAPAWQPELSAAGSKAALLAHKSGGKLDLWMPEASAEGNSAAGIAMRNKGLSPQLNHGNTATGKQNALTAATGAVASENRRRAQSVPSTVPNYPDAANSAHNSLNAATIAHKPSMKKHEDANRWNSDAMQSARITHAGSNIPKEMFGSAPPVSIEVEEKRRQDALRASAISMAKKMYDTQQNTIKEASGIGSASGLAARGAAARPASMSSASPGADIKTQAMQYIHLQEHAQKLAAERISKLDPDSASQFRSYYGYNDQPQRSRLSVRRGRRRASSESEMVDSDDEEQARQVRSQMSLFNTQLAQVDAKKRQKDRETLLAAAERKVHAQMHSMDEKVFMETGKVSPAMMEEWEAKARAKAAEESEQRMVNHGKVHVGGGRFLDQSEIDAIAAGRVQPTLNEIGEAAEAQRARDEEKRLDEEEKKRLAAVEKERGAELKAEEKRIKNEEKAAEKTRKAEEKAAAKTEKRIKKENRKSRGVPKVEHEEEDRSDAPLAVGPPIASTDNGNVRPALLTTNPSYHAEVEAIGDITSSDEEHEPSSDSSVTDAITNRATTATISTSTPTTSGPLPPTADTTTAISPTPGIRSGKDAEPAPPTTVKESRGLKSLFSRLKRRSRAGTGGSASSSKEDPTSPTGSVRSFVGGAALTGIASRKSADQSTSTSAVPTASVPTASTETDRQRRSPSISSLESEAADEANRGRGRRQSEVSSEEEEFEEARDAFDEDLAPPPSFGRVADGGKGRATESPVRDSRFMEEF